jgi:glycosyltransferase involved in cell wall biosynthesis
MSRTHLPTPLTKKWVIASVIPEDWGGSEVLWGQSVPLLMQAGYAITVLKPKAHLQHPELAQLAQQGVQFETWMHQRPLWRRISRKVVSKYSSTQQNAGYIPGFARTPGYYSLFKKLKNLRPEGVLINQGINFDGMDVAYACHQLGIPYVLLCHKAVDHFWPWPADRNCIKSLFFAARAVFYVSKHTRRITEHQMGAEIPHGHIVQNPILIPKLIDYPSIQNGVYKWCCIGRIQLVDKGQDLLLRVLSQEKWKQRPLIVDIIGSGPDREALESLAKHLDVRNVRFVGYANDRVAMWKNYHALISPSRCEGLPLTIMEAMKAGRMVITTEAGGSAEVIEEGSTGFVSYVHEASLDEAMEKAWAARDKWKDMGLAAHTWVMNNCSSQPEREFINLLESYLCKESR